MTVVFQNVTVVDGLDGEYRANVYVDGEKISAIEGPDCSLHAQQVIDGSGKLLTPGIIDIHRHADLKALGGTEWFELAQGITTMVSGNCGFSPFPMNSAFFDDICAYSTPILGKTPENLRDIDAQGFFDEIRKRPLKNNCGFFVGNGQLRRAVNGFSAAPLTDDQISRICTLLDESLQAGALGLSMGIMYSPECFYRTEELALLAKTAAKHHKPVVSHIRGEGTSVVKSVDEMIRIGRLSGAKIHISHMKAAGTDMWGHGVDAILEHIEAARGEGIDVTFDAYPYTAGSTTLLSLIPPEFLAGGSAGVIRALADPEEREALLRAFGRKYDDWDNYILSLGWGRIIISDSSDPADIGKSIEEIAAQKGGDPAETALDLLQRENGSIPIVLEEMAPADVERIITQKDCIVISDSLYTPSGMPHPRKYGAFQRFLCQYVKEKGLLSRREAIDKITRMPAEYLGLEKRGRILPGYYADLNVLDWDALLDKATYTDPIRDSVGIDQVWVNGRPAWNKQGITHENSGKLILI